MVKKYLIPREENDHRPHLLRPKSVIFVCAVAIAVEGVFLVSASFIIPRSRLFGTILVNALVDGTNGARVSADLPALHENALLDLAAQEKADDMVAHGYFAHTSPDGVTPWYWFKNVGYNYLAAGENLAVDFTDSSDVTSAWLASPEHRANIMDHDYSDIGMAVAQGTFEGHPATFVVELFGTSMPVFNLAPVASAAKTPAAPNPLAAPAAVARGTSSSASENRIVSLEEPIPSATQGTQAAQAGAAGISAPAAPAATPGVPVAHAAESNPVQAAAADPRRMVDYFYFAIALIFATALILNIFIKIRVQHPQVILGGMVVILIAGLLIVLNQHFGTGVVVL